MSSPEISASHNSDPSGVGAAFERLTAKNHAVFNNFDPQRPDNQTITLTPPDLSPPEGDGEASSQESPLIRNHRIKMLQSLDFRHEPQAPEPLLDYSLKNEDGSTSLWQFGSINRATDGQRVEVVSRYRIPQGDETGFVEEITLLSSHLVDHEKAKVKQFSEEGSEGYAVSQRLLGEFHLGGVVVEALELSPQEKKEMLAAYDKTAELGLAADNPATIHALRQGLVSAMMPPRRFGRGLKKRPDQKELVTKYELALDELTSGFNDPETQQQIRKAEQLHRLTELNMQLNSHLRKQEGQTRGNAVLATLVSGAFGAGATKHPSVQNVEPLQQFIEHAQEWQQLGVGALVGGSIGFGLLALGRAVRGRKVDTNQGANPEKSDLQESLQKEKLAIDRLWITQSPRKRGDDVRPL